MATIPTTTTPDDLVARLSQVRQARNDMRIMKRVCFNGASFADDDDTVMQEPVKKTKNNKLGCNSVRDAMQYFNRYLVLGINAVGFAHTTEDATSQILYDLTEFPLEMVLSRLEREGAWIDK
jgi:hypothetical protein